LTVEQLLAERQAWESEREQLLRRQEMDSREIVRLSKLIGALRQKLFGTGRGEKVDHAQLEIQLGLTRNRGRHGIGVSPIYFVFLKPSTLSSLFPYARD
jgi:hypothetical protein